MKPRTRLVVTSPVLRWTLLGLVIAVAVAVAVWPRGSGDADETPPAPPPTHSSADLAAARERAALPGCAHPGDDRGGGPLTGIPVRCLGNGGTVTMGDVLGGEPTLINVWATWCTACKKEMPLLARYANGDGVRVVEVLVNSHAYGGLDMMNGLGVHLPTVYDADGTLSAALHLPKGLPASYLVDAEGTAHFIGSPRVFGSLDQIRRAVSERLPGDR